MGTATLIKIMETIIVMFVSAAATSLLGYLKAAGRRKRIDLLVLRRNIVQDYRIYSERGEMPSYTREIMEEAFKEYEALGGNHYISEIMDKARAIPLNDI
jgi:hypothetical protein